MTTVRIEYDDSTVRKFIWASVLFGVVGMLVGVVIAFQLIWPSLNLGISYTTFSHLRPLHTNAVIFAFVGNMMFAGIYYSTQRLLKVRMPSDLLSAIHFWGWQLIIVAAAISLPMGFTTSKEYAELEWPIDLAITGIWVVFAVNFFWAIAVRNEKHLYVALWFYISTIITVAVLHIVNSLEIPVSLTKSYSLFSGVQDALVQWWYGHNAVAFFLTTPILGIMYYFLPKAAERPVYSYRLSVVHFWSLVFMYIWAGPHHLLYTALPDWAQSLGMIFSLMLWAPSWGGMLNGLLTLRGAWAKLREDPVLKFFAAGVTFYGMATFEGPLLSIKSVSALAHYTDWIIGHVHSGALGWNGLMAAGMFYWLIPRLFDTKLWSVKLADAHFWMATVGIILYVISMWIAGINQGLMLRAMNPDGTLTYPNFVETVLAIRPMYIVRALGGTLYLVGFLLMVVNLVKTALAGHAVNGTAEVAVPEKVSARGFVGDVLTTFGGKPFLLGGVALVLMVLLGLATPTVAVAVLVVSGLFITGVFLLGKRERGFVGWFGLVERQGFTFTALTLGAVLIGGVAELVPTILLKQAVPTSGTSQKLYTALEQEGRDVYVKEGCYVCHSQMVRPMLPETLRYGEVSRAEEFIYDHPFQWGSKRTGPDLHRVGGRYPSLWHYTHLMDPRSTSPGSIMPSFAWLADTRLHPRETANKLLALQRIGVPYTNDDIDRSEPTLKAQATRLAAELAVQGIEVDPLTEMVALIAYLQRLGRDTGVSLEPLPLVGGAPPSGVVGGGR